MAVHLHRHKFSLRHTSKTRKKKDPLLAVKGPKAGLTDFDMDIDLPLGNATQPAAGATTTITGPITADSNVLFQVWYSDSAGNVFPLDGSTVTITTPAGGDQPHQWNFDFTLPATTVAGDYTFYIQGTFSPPPLSGGGPLTAAVSLFAFSTITLSAPFTV